MIGAFTSFVADGTGAGVVLAELVSTGAVGAASAIAGLGVPALADALEACGNEVTNGPRCAVVIVSSAFFTCAG